MCRSWLRAISSYADHQGTHQPRRRDHADAWLELDVAGAQIQWGTIFGAFQRWSFAPLSDENGGATRPGRTRASP
jgi:hypothetical protein